MFHITHGTAKMKDIPSINTNSLNNSFCQSMSKNEDYVCNKCYSNRYLKFRPPLAELLDLNDEILSMEKLKMKDIPVMNNLYVRFNSFGELINEQHYRNIVKICKRNPKTTFTLWSKRVGLVGYKKPENLILVFSEPAINSLDEKIPTFFDKLFVVFTREFAKEHKVKINCSKACINCLKCYSKDNQDTIIREIIK